MGKSNSWLTMTDMYFESDILQKVLNMYWEGFVLCKQSNCELLKKLLNTDSEKKLGSESDEDDMDMVTDDIVEYYISKPDTEFELCRCCFIRGLTNNYLK